MIKLQLLWKLKSLSSTYSWPKSYKKFCAWISQFAAGVYRSCAAWMTSEGFHILTVNNYQLSKIKTETPTNKCSFQSKQTTCSFICFPIMEQHCLSITSFVPLRILHNWVKALIDFVQLCEVFVLMLLCSYTAYEQLVAQSMSPLISLNWF